MKTNLSKNILNWLWAIAAILAIRFFAGFFHPSQPFYQFCSISLILGGFIYRMLTEKQTN